MATRPRLPAAIALWTLSSMAFLFTNPCLAAAAWMTESGGADMGMASAGRAAIAADATTLAANPAGMAALADVGFLAAALAAAMDLELEGSGTTTGNVDDRTGPMPMAAVFGTHGVGRWTLGMGVYSYLGLGLDFGAGWAGSRAVEDVRLRSMNFAPAAAYRLTDRLAVGGTLGAQYVDMRAGLAVANDAMFYGPPVGLPDGHLRLTGDAWALNGSLGLAYQVNDDTRIGLAWQSQVSHSINLELRGEDLHPVLDAIVQQQTARLDATVPQQLTFSVTHQVTPDTLLAANAGWQQWSVLGRSHLQVGDSSAPLFDNGLRDTWSVALGLRHRLDDRWTLSAGVAYDSDPARQDTMPVYFPVAEQLRLAMGVDYRHSPKMLVRLAASVVSQGDVRIAQESYPVPLPGIPPVTGRVENSRIYVVGLAVDYRP